MKDISKYTPMLQQYLTIKENYKDALLLFRLGDFYELYFEEARLAAKELEINLGFKPLKELDEKIPMCGVPYHAIEGYISRLISRGYKVAICEQVEDPAKVKGKGLVKRDVVRILTPGTATLQDTLDAKENNYITAVVKTFSGYGLCYTDLSTGEINVMVSLEEDLLSDLINLGSREIIIGSDVNEDLFNNLKSLKSLIISYEEEQKIPISYLHLADTIVDTNLKLAFGRMINYLIKTQKQSLGHLQEVRLSQKEKHMRMDYNTRRNLELTENLRTKGRKGSLLGLLDKSNTAMGSRLLKQWLELPEVDKTVIETRQSIVTGLIDNFLLKEKIKKELEGIYDLERLMGRVALGTSNARDFVQLKTSLEKVPGLKSCLQELNIATLNKALVGLKDCNELKNLLEKALLENPSATLREGNIFKEGYNKDLDLYKDAIENGTEWIKKLEKEEREKLGIKNLKLKPTKNYGYCIEVSKMNLHLIPENAGYERKVTLANTERFMTEELRNKNELISSAKDMSVQLEFELFQALKDEVKKEISNIQTIAKLVGYIDALQSFATVSEQYGYVKPVFNTSSIIDIKEGRHPVVEKVLVEKNYVSNDCYMSEDVSSYLITGPNMSGKSTYMRQLALISVLAQVGCYVPASFANLPLFDNIFTRIGAGDDLASGHSTFMLEMLETNYALEHATKNSLILLDEIGRGTATFDGMALAQSIIEYIHDEVGAKTLFSTHYHELTALVNNCEQLRNYHVTAEELDGELKFLHKVLPGPSDKSYGVHVARLAKLPDKILSRANELLHIFEG